MPLFCCYSLRALKDYEVYRKTGWIILKVHDLMMGQKLQVTWTVRLFDYISIRKKNSQMCAAITHIRPKNQMVCGVLTTVCSFLRGFNRTVIIVSSMRTIHGCTTLCLISVNSLKNEFQDKRSRKPTKYIFVFKRTYPLSFVQLWQPN